MNKAKVVTRCIDDILAGKSTLEDCAVKYPQLAGELRTLFAIADNIKKEYVIPSPEFKQRARNCLLRAMQPPSKSCSICDWLFLPGRILRLPTAVSFALIFVILIGSAGYASKSSLPDDILYPVKTGLETVQLVLTPNPESKASLRLSLAQRRLDETIAQSSLGRDVTPSAIEAIPAQIDAAIKEMGNKSPEDLSAFSSKLTAVTSRQQTALNQAIATASEANRPALEKALDVTRRGNLIAAIASGNSLFLSSLPSVRDEQIEASQFSLQGNVVSVANGVWNVGGLVVKDVKSPDVPPQGSQVQIAGITSGNQTFVNKIDREEKPAEDIVKVEGVFRGTNPEGTKWYVGSISVDKPEDVTPPQQGNRVHLEGSVQDGVFVAKKGGKKETERDGNNTEARKSDSARPNSSDGSKPKDSDGSKPKDGDGSKPKDSDGSKPNDGDASKSKSDVNRAAPSSPEKASDRESRPAPPPAPPAPPQNNRGGSRR